MGDMLDRSCVKLIAYSLRDQRISLLVLDLDWLSTLVEGRPNIEDV